MVSFAVYYLLVTVRCLFVCLLLVVGNILHCLQIFVLYQQVYDLQIKATTEDVASINIAAINFVGLTVDAGGDTKYPLLDPESIYIYINKGFRLLKLLPVFVMVYGCHGLA